MNEKDLLKKAKRYAKLHHVKLSTVGRRATNDARLFTRIESGNGSCTMPVFLKVSAWLDAALAKEGK